MPKTKEEQRSFYVLFLNTGCASEVQCWVCCWLATGLPSFLAQSHDIRRPLGGWGGHGVSCIVRVSSTVFLLKEKGAWKGSRESGGLGANIQSVMYSGLLWEANAPCNNGGKEEGGGRGWENKGREWERGGWGSAWITSVSGHTATGSCCSLQAVPA